MVVSEPLTVTTKVLVLVDLGFTEEAETNEGINARAVVSMIGATVTMLLT